MSKLDISSNSSRGIPCMKRLFYIEKEKFLCEMLQETLKFDGVDCYTINELADNLYLLKDMSPDLILFDVETILNKSEDFFAYAQRDCAQIPLVATGFEGDFEKLDETYRSLVSKFIPKPLSPTGLFELIFH